MSLLKAPNADFHHLFHTNLDREMVEVCVYQLLFFMARNLAVLSLVFYMYVELNYSAWQVCAYFAIAQLFFAFSAFFSAKIIEHIGVKHTMGIRPLMVGLYYIAVVLFMTENFWMSMLLLAPFNFLRSIAATSSQVAYDVFLSHHLTKENRGEALAWLQIAIMISTVTAPIIGGIVTKFLGFDWTIWIATVFFIASFVVLLLTPDQKFKLPYSLRAVFRDTFKNTPHSLYAAEVGRTFFDTVLFVIWPLFLVLVIGDIAEIGLIAGLSSGIAMMVAFWVGRKIDSQSGSAAKIVRHGAWRSTFINLVRGLWWEPISLGLADAISKINDQTIKLPYDVEFYRWVNEKNSLERTHIRQILFQLLFLGFLSSFTFIFLVFNTAPGWVFVLIFVSAALTLTLCSNITKLPLTDKP